MTKKRPSYTVTVYRQADHGVVEQYYFVSELEAKVAKIRLEPQAIERGWDLELEEVYDD